VRNAPRTPVKVAKTNKFDKRQATSDKRAHPTTHKTKHKTHNTTVMMAKDEPLIDPSLLLGLTEKQKQEALAAAAAARRAEERAEQRALVKAMEQKK
jgi:CMP-2-keto-3-deoxyoctulosonic acid synthetase